MYPWPSFGGFQFKPTEHEIWATDVGWVRTPSYSRDRPLGSDTDVIIALSIGSADRSFELILTPARFDALEQLMNTTAIFTDWGRPIPDSRLAFLTEVSAIEDVISYSRDGTAIRKRRTRVALASA